MFRTAKNAAAALALTGLVLSQPAMAVRSSDSLPAPGAKVTSINRVGSPLGSREEVAGIPTLGWVIAALIAAGVIIIIADNNHNHKSPG